jgi:hypothetical protein
MTAWTSMDGKLVFMFMRSTGRCRPGICSTPPGHRSANSAVAMIDGAQSLIAAAVQARPPLLCCVLNGQAAAKRRRGRSEPVEGKGRQSLCQVHGCLRRARYYRL